MDGAFIKRSKQPRLEASISCSVGCSIYSSVYSSIRCYIGRTIALTGIALLLGLLGYPNSAMALPPDVRSNHWAVPYVEQALTSHLLSPINGKEFHGEAKVTRQEAVIAIAKLAKMLETGEWKAHESRPVSEKVIQAVTESDWRTQKVTRYEFAKVLVCMGDYVANGLKRPAPGAKNLGKSTVIAPVPLIKLDKSHPAYASLSYLVEARMLTKNSPLLPLEEKPILGQELSRALSEMVAGLTDRATEMGKDENGDTPDINSTKKKK